MSNLIDLQLGRNKDNVTWQPTAEERKKIRDFQSDMDIAIRYRSQFEDMWNEAQERYEAKPFYNEDGSAGVVLPIAKWIVEQKLATEMKNPPSFSYEPGEFEEDKQVAAIMEQIVRKHVWHLKEVNLDYKLDIGNQVANIFGGYYQYIGWRKIYRVIRDDGYTLQKADERLEDGDDENEHESNPKDRTEDKTELETENTKKLKERQVLYYDDICVDNFYPQDVWLHPLALGVSDSPWIITRKRMDYNSFLEAHSNSDEYKNVDQVRPGKWMTFSRDSATLYRDFQADDKNQVVIFEKWNKMTDARETYANGVIICDKPNPYDHKELPFVDHIDRQRFNSYVGEGEPERIATICDAINAFINISIDKEKRAGSGINLLDDNLSDFDDVASIFDSTTATRVSDPKNAFVHYDLPGMSSSTDRMISMLMDYLIYATGVDFRQITDMNASTQATVAAIRREITQGRLNLNVRRNENRGFKRLGWLLMKTVQQFYPIPLVNDLAGLDGDKALKYRTIRVKGMNISEKPVKGAGGKMIYTVRSLRMKGIGDQEMGFFQARPAYIRSKGDLVCRVVQDSTFAASRELEKANARDYLTTAGTAMEVDPQSGQPKPVLSLRYGLERYIEAMGYDKEKAFAQDQDNDDVAKQEAQKIMSGQGEPEAGEAQPVGGAELPPEVNPARLTGTNSEPVQEVKADLMNNPEQ